MTQSVTDSPYLEPIKHLSLADRVTEQMRRALLTGALRPGEQVSIVDLATRFGVSHIPVREAMRRLDSQGLIVLRPGRSATVAAVGEHDLHAVYRLRSLLEVDLAVRSAPLLTEGDVTDAMRYLEEYAGAAQDVDVLSNAHHRFHLVLLNPAANDWDRRLLHQLWDAASRYLHLVFSHLEPHGHDAHGRLALHEEVLAAVRSEDPQRITSVWRRHLEESEEMIRRGLEALSARSE